MESRKIEMARKRPRKIIDYYLKKYSRFVKDDKLFLNIRWWCNMRYHLDWNNLQTYNEKLQWIKLYDHNPLYTTLVDKVEAKKYAASIIGKKYIIPTLGVWERAEDIPFDLLPDKFVLKCNHNSGVGMCICTDKSKLNLAKVRKSLNSALSHSYYMVNREWPYKNVQRRILAEKYITPIEQIPVIYHRFYCINGEPRYCRILNETKNGIKLYNMDWECVGSDNQRNNDEKKSPRPPFFCSMIDVANKLINKETPFSIVDIYNIDNINFIGNKRDIHSSSLGLSDNSSFDIMKIIQQAESLIDEEIPFVHYSIRNTEINDYKFYCLNGQVECIMVCTERKKGVKFYFFSPEWEFLRWDKKTQYEQSDHPIPCPDNLQEMIKIAESLAKGLTSVRIDLYNIQGQIYFGEFTFFTNSGMDGGITRECDEILGKKLILPTNNRL